MDMQEQLNAIQRDYQTALNRVTEIASNRFESLLKSVLDDWAERFPRHKFTAWEGHGIISLEVTPAVLGETHMDFLTFKNSRGAIAEIAETARLLTDAYCVEHRESFCFSPVEGKPRHIPDLATE